MSMSLAKNKERVDSLRTTIENFRRKGLAVDVRYLNAMQELDLLTGGGLEFQKSFTAIKAAARARKFISYGQVAAANRISWAKARRPMNTHLDELCLWAYAKGWPLITSIVVERDHLENGLLGKAALAGFLSAARRCGIVVGQAEEECLKDQQEQTFVWAAQDISL